LCPSIPNIILLRRSTQGMSTRGTILTPFRNVEQLGSKRPPGTPERALELALCQFTECNRADIYSVLLRGFPFLISYYINTGRQFALPTQFRLVYAITLFDDGGRVMTCMISSRKKRREGGSGRMERRGRG
jgi:hypothetical protein